MTLVIGVTGGMASGKSTAARMMQRDGVTLFDADACVHLLMKDHPECIGDIAKHFPEALQEGAIARHVLAKEIAADEAKLKTLESLIHPYVREEEIRAITAAKEQGLKAIVLDIPLLFESGAERLCDVVVVVDVDPETQRVRAFERADMTEEKFAKLLARQLDPHVRSSKADIVISSTMGLEEMQQAIDLLMEGLLSHA